MLIFKGTLQKERTKRLKFKSECCHRPRPMTVVLAVVASEATGEAHIPTAAAAVLGTGPKPRGGVQGKRIRTDIDIPYPFQHVCE